MNENPSLHSHVNVLRLAIKELKEAVGEERKRNREVYESDYYKNFQRVQFLENENLSLKKQIKQWAEISKREADGRETAEAKLAAVRSALAVTT